MIGGMGFSSRVFILIIKKFEKSNDKKSLISGISILKKKIRGQEIMILSRSSAFR
jgi:hypothetical protein